MGARRALMLTPCRSQRSIRLMRAITTTRSALAGRIEAPRSPGPAPMCRVAHQAAAALRLRTARLLDVPAGSRLAHVAGVVERRCGVAARRGRSAGRVRASGGRLSGGRHPAADWGLGTIERVRTSTTIRSRRTSTETQRRCQTIRRCGDHRVERGGADRGRRSRRAEGAA